jgi:hypothetical protein
MEPDRDPQMAHDVMQPAPLDVSGDAAQQAQAQQQMMRQLEGVRPGRMMADLIREDKERQGIASSYAAGSTFIYQLIMGLALTNATYLFFATSPTALRPITSYNLLESVLFFILVAFAAIRIFEYTAGIGFNIKHVYPQRGGVAYFVVDTFAGIIEGLLFYVLSIALAQVPTDASTFFLVIGTVLGLDIVTELIAFLFIGHELVGCTERAVIMLDCIAIGVGAVFLFLLSGAAYSVPALVGVFALRVLIYYLMASAHLFISDE